jgi:hypothetical protein
MDILLKFRLRADGCEIAGGPFDNETGNDKLDSAIPCDAGINAISLGNENPGCREVESVRMGEKLKAL